MIHFVMWFGIAKLLPHYIHGGNNLKRKKERKKVQFCCDFSLCQIVSLF